MKELNMTESQFYKRNKKLGIHRSFKENKKEETKQGWKFDLLHNKWIRN